MMACASAYLPPRSRPPSLVAAALLLAACPGDDGARSDGSDDGIPTQPTSGTTADTNTGPGDETLGTGADTTGGCPDPQVCGDGCCAAGELCVENQCVPDCGAEPARIAAASAVPATRSATWASAWCRAGPATPRSVPPP